MAENDPVLNKIIEAFEKYSYVPHDGTTKENNNQKISIIRSLVYDVFTHLSRRRTGGFRMDLVEEPFNELISELGERFANTNLDTHSPEGKQNYLTLRSELVMLVTQKLDNIGYWAENPPQLYDIHSAFPDEITGRKRDWADIDATEPHSQKPKFPKKTEPLPYSSVKLPLEATLVERPIRTANTGSRLTRWLDKIFF